MSVDNPALFLRGLGLVIGGALFWILYFDLKDRFNPEPRRLLVKAFVIGNFSALLGLALYRLVERLGAPPAPGVTRTEILVYCLALIGPIEEGAKFFVARTVIFRWKHFDEPIDGLVYASAVAIGFATLENVLYLPHLTWTEQLARALTTPLTHSLFASLWGFGVGRAFFSARSRRARLSWQVLPLIASMLLHGFYDYLLFALNAPIATGGLALVLWIFMVAYARRIVRARPAVRT